MFAIKPNGTQEFAAATVQLSTSGGRSLSTSARCASEGLSSMFRSTSEGSMEGLRRGMPAYRRGCRSIKPRFTSFSQTTATLMLRRA